MTTPKPQTYRVTCLSTLLYRTEFTISASSPEEAIEFCKNRSAGDGKYLDHDHEKFLETIDETDWEAEPQ